MHKAAFTRSGAAIVATLVTAVALMLPPVAAGQPAATRPPAPPGDGVTVVTATAIIRGRVLDAVGVPVRSAEVRLHSTDGRDHRVATTDASGQYEIRDLTPGSWNLKASKAGFVSQSSSQSSPLDQSRPIVIANGQRLTADVILSRAGAIAGRVVDEAGDPLIGVQVMALRVRTLAGRRRLASSGVPDLTDDTGSFRLYGLPPGSYFVGAVAGRVTVSTDVVGALSRAPEFLTDEVTFYYPGTRDIDLAQAVDIASGQEQPGLSVTVPPAVRGVTVSGQIINASGLPAERPAVHVTSRDGISRGSIIQGLANSTATGRFMLRNLSPGDYVISAEILNGDPASAEHGRLAITVGTSDIDNVVVTTTRARTVRGTIVSGSGTPLPRPLRMSIALESPDLTIGLSRVEMASDAEFTAAGIIGVHSLRIENLPSGWMVKSIEIAGHDITSGMFDFSTVPSSATLRVVITDRLGELTGQVTSRTRQRHASVVVFPDDESRWQYPARLVASGRSDGEGRFAVTGLLANVPYRAVAVSYLESEEWQDPEFLKKMRPAAVAFELRDGEKKTLDLPLLQR